MDDVDDVPLPHDTAVFVAPAVETTAGLLDLVDVAPAVVSVRWHVPGDVEQLTSGQFLDRWAAEGRCCVDATLHVLGRRETGSPSIRVQLSDPRIAGSALRWTVLSADEPLPPTSGSCVLVVDPPASL